MRNVPGANRLARAKPFAMSVGVAVLLAVVCSALVFVFARTAGPLASDIRVALPSAAPISNDGKRGDLCHDCDPDVNDAGAGEAFALAGVFFGGIAAAAVGVALAWRARRARTTWRPIWGTIVHAAFLFQLCSLVLGVVVLLVFALVEPRAIVREGRATAALLVLHIVWNATGLSSWRKMRQRIAPRGFTSVVP